MSGFFANRFVAAQTSPVTPPVAVAAPVGGGEGVGLASIGNPPIPSLFADTIVPDRFAPAGVGQTGVGQAGIGQGKPHDPFAKAVAALKNERLMRLADDIFDGKLPPDNVILDYLLAAERKIEQDLRVFIVPREIIPDGTPFAEVAALAAQGKPMVEEPGYPYDTRVFNGSDLEARHRPIINVYRIWYAYQGEGTGASASVQALYDIPNDWIQIDRKYGRINLLPTSTFTNLPLNSFLLSVLGSGRDIPFGLKVRYSAGLRDAKRDYPNLIQLIKRQAVVSLMDDEFLPQSGSISGDGLSESLSRDVGKYREALDKQVDDLRAAIHGIQMTVLG